MNKLIVTRGCPGCGKSTWIKEHNLEKYKLCPDDIRLMCLEPEKQEDGTYRIPQYGQDFVWYILKEMLEYRLQHNYLTIIDATCNRISDIKYYKELCDKYNYELTIIDFSDVPLEECLKRNEQRDTLKWVPREAISKIFDRIKSQSNQLPLEGIKYIKSKNFVDINYI